MANKKPKDYKRTWRPVSKGSEGPKKSVPNRKLSANAVKKKYGLSSPSRKRASSKPPMGSKRKTAADVSKERKQRVIAKKAGPTKRRVAGEPPNRSMASTARSIRAGRVRNRKVGQMNRNIKNMQGRRPY